MEGALVALALKAGFNPEHARSEWPRLDEIPFDAQHRFMATLHAGPTGERGIFVKGAPERLLEMCIAQAGADGEQPLDRAYWAEPDRAGRVGRRARAGVCREACPERPGTALVRRSR